MHRTLHFQIPSYVEVDDLFGEGLIGLLKAIKNYEQSHGTPFETYASCVIRNEILMHIRRIDPLHSKKFRSLERKIYDTTTHLREILGRGPFKQEIIAHMGISIDDLLILQEEKAYQAAIPLSMLAFNTEEGIEGAKLGENKMPTNYQDPLDIIIGQENISTLERGVATLNPREQRFIRLYYYNEMKMADIARIFSVSERTVESIHLVIKRKLRSFFVNGISSQDKLH